MDTQETRSRRGEVLRRVAYVVLPTIIVGCLAYAFVIDQSGKNIAVLAVAFVAFVAILFLSQRGGHKDQRHLVLKTGPLEVNAASGRLMNGPHVDTGGNFRGVGRK